MANLECDPVDTEACVGTDRGCWLSLMIGPVPSELVKLDEGELAMVRMAKGAPFSRRHGPFSSDCNELFWVLGSFLRRTGEA